MRHVFGLNIRIRKAQRYSDDGSSEFSDELFLVRFEVDALKRLTSPPRVRFDCCDIHTVREYNLKRLFRRLDVHMSVADV